MSVQHQERRELLLSSWATFKILYSFIEYYIYVHMLYICMYIILQNICTTKKCVFNNFGKWLHIIIITTSKNISIYIYIYYIYNVYIYIIYIIYIYISYIIYIYIYFFFSKYFLLKSSSSKCPFWWYSTVVTLAMYLKFQIQIPFKKKKDSLIWEGTQENKSHRFRRVRISWFRSQLHLLWQ